MFLFRWLKKLVILAVIVTATLYIADYNWKGKTVREHFKEAYSKGLISEGLKDIRTWVADIFRIGRKVTTDGITDRDRAALEQVIKNELSDNVKRLKEEAEKAKDRGPDTGERKQEDKKQ